MLFGSLFSGIGGFDPAAAERWAGILRQRSIGKRGQAITEPAGSEYGVDHA